MQSSGVKAALALASSMKGLVILADPPHAMHSVFSSTEYLASFFDPVPSFFDPVLKELSLPVERDDNLGLVSLLDMNDAPTREKMVRATGAETTIGSTHRVPSTGFTRSRDETMPNSVVTTGKVTTTAI